MFGMLSPLSGFPRTRVSVDVDDRAYLIKRQHQETLKHGAFVRPTSCKGRLRTKGASDAVKSADLPLFLTLVREENFGADSLPAPT